MSNLAAAAGLTSDRVAALIADLTARGLSVATAESLTGGLLAALLTEVPGSSAVVRGALVVYATDLKHLLAGVDEDLLAAHGPVHPLVAGQLADGARRVCGAQIGVGLTGVAGPDPQNGIPVGTWYCAISGPRGHRDALASVGGEQTSGLTGHGGASAGRQARTRTEIRAQAVRAGIDLLSRIPAT